MGLNVFKERWKSEKRFILLKTWTFKVISVAAIQSRTEPASRVYVNIRQRIFQLHFH